MLGLFRKWSIALKRRRLRKERALLQNYKSIETETRGDELRCHNCKAPLTGPFCHICGQRDNDLRRPIWTFFRELMDAIFDTDSKIIKTILLLVLVPGGLSRAFMEGRRARFLPPFRLYVVLLFVFFSTISLANVLILDIQVQPKAEMVAAREAADAERELERAVREIAQGEEHQRAQQQILKQVAEDTAKLEQRLLQDGLLAPGEITEKLESDIARPDVAVPVTPPDAPSLIEAIDSVERDDKTGAKLLRKLLGGIAKRAGSGDENAALDLEAAQDRVRELLDGSGREFSLAQRAALESVLDMDVEAIELVAENRRGGNGFNIDGDDFPYDVNLFMFAKNDNQEREGIKQEDIDFILNDPQVPELVKKATEGLADALQDPLAFNKLFNEWLPWALVVLMPVFALILRVFHWGKQRFYLNQLVFALHFHSFLFVLLTAFTFIVPTVGGESAMEIFWIGTSLYLIIALKVGQDQSWIRAFLKAGFIWVSYFYTMMATMAVVMFMGLSDSGIGDIYDMIQQGAGPKTEAVSEPEILP